MRPNQEIRSDMGHYRLVHLVATQIAILGSILLADQPNTLALDVGIECFEAP
jgi:hypothetical protein